MSDTPYTQGFRAGLVWGTDQERERIIKLLEAESRCKGTGHDYNGNCYCDTIALIKGENK